MTVSDPVPTPVSPPKNSKPVPGLHAGKIYGNRYCLLERIAIGGMGEVWKAEDRLTKTAVALKILRPEYAGEEQFLSRLRVEASNAGQIVHPNLARVLDSGEDDGLGWIIMELVDGKPLTRMLQQRRVLPLDILLPILRQTADALSAVHAAGIVHRDIKPGNILITGDNQVKLTDFGISRSQNQVTLTAAGMVMGTAQYLPPEQAVGQQATPSGDLYALGVIAYEALAGKRPFTGESQVDIAFAHVNSPVPLLPASVPEPVRKLVMSLLDKKPGNRPPTAAKLSYMISELEASLLGHGMPQHPDAPAQPIVSLGGGTVPAPFDMPRTYEVAAETVRERRNRCFPPPAPAVESLPDSAPSDAEADAFFDSLPAIGVDSADEPSGEIVVETDDSLTDDDVTVPATSGDDEPFDDPDDPPAEQPATVLEPQPVDIDVPQPVNIDVSQPVDLDVPQPVDFDVSQPLNPDASAPVDNATPQPAHNASPQAVEAAAPDPAIVWTPTGHAPAHPFLPPAYDGSQARHMAEAPPSPPPRHSRGESPGQRLVAWTVVIGISVFAAILIALFSYFSSRAAQQSADFFAGDPLASVMYWMEVMHV